MDDGSGVIDHPILSDLARFGVKLGLDRMRELLGALGNPHLELPVVHVAGTNGKGSVVFMLEAMLLAAGRRPACYTSPHLQRVNERIRVGGQEISDEVLSDLLVEVDAARAAIGAPGLTWFEMATAVAFLHFARSRIDLLVLEVGLGGRLDATNIVPDPLVTVITSIGLDHMEQLGHDLASIAAEKAGIVKPGVPLVTGPLPSDAARVIRSIAAERGAPTIEWDRDYRASVEEGGFGWSGGGQGLRDLTLRLEGAHQIENAAVAIAAAMALPPALRPDPDAIREGLAKAHNPGRMEWLGPDLLIDCAHNGDGAVRLAAYLRDLPRDRPRTLLLGMSDDKDARRMVVILGPQVDRVWTTRCAHPRAREPGKLAGDVVGLEVPVLPAGPIEEALPSALAAGGLTIVAGSVFLAGAVRDLIGIA